MPHRTAFAPLASSLLSTTLDIVPFSLLIQCMCLAEFAFPYCYRPPFSSLTCWSYLPRRATAHEKPNRCGPPAVHKLHASSCVLPSTHNNNVVHHKRFHISIFPYSVLRLCFNIAGNARGFSPVTSSTHPPALDLSSARAARRQSRHTSRMWLRRAQRMRCLRMSLPTNPPEEGSFVKQTLLTSFTYEMKVMTGETFGPVIPMHESIGDEEAVM